MRTDQLVVPAAEPRLRKFRGNALAQMLGTAARPRGVVDVRVNRIERGSGFRRRADFSAIGKNLSIRGIENVAGGDRQSDAGIDFLDHL